MVALNKQVMTQIDAKVVRVYAKPSDSGVYTLLGHNQAVVHEVDGYVPRWFPGDNYGDYLILDIDIETGQILNWVVPTAARLETWIDETT